MKTTDDFKVIVYNPCDEKLPIVQNFLQLPGIEHLSYQNEDSLITIINQLKKRGLPSKEVLILKEFKGRIFQECPGSCNMICCNYLLLNTCFDCLYDCTYCFLNSYLNAYGIVQFTNTKQILDEIDQNISHKIDRIYRIGTGEYTDSLMMDHVTGIARLIIEHIVQYSHLMVEFKTKSNNIDHLLNIKEKGNTVLAWSLNTKKNIADYEAGTANLQQRIEAARKASDAGYLLAFHFDPIIPYDGFLDEYMHVIDTLFAHVDPNKIVWISLGCFRHSPGFKEIIQEKYPFERLTLEEMFPGPDGKLRYLKQTRIAIYKQFKEHIGSHPGNPYVYLCMETADVWNQVFGVDFSENNDLELALSEHMRQFTSL